MGLTKWYQTLTINDNSTITPHLTSKTSVEVNTTPNSFNHSFGITNTVKINTNGSDDSGIQFDYSNLEIGDMIEIQAEVRVLSGENPMMKITQYSPTTFEEYSPLKKFFQLGNQWQIIHFKTFVVMPQLSTNHKAFVGLEKGKIGIFEIRSVNVTATTKAISPLDKVDRGFYRYIIKKVNGVWTFQNGSSVGELTHPNTWSLVIKYPPQAYPSVSVSSNQGMEYLIGYAPPSGTTLTLNCKKISDNNNSWDGMPDNTVLYVTIFYKW